MVVAYDGHDFCGWAPQTGHRSVLGTLTEGIREVSGEEIEITGASRTDSGAHALGQVCHFDATWPIPPEKIPRVVNKVLPGDLSVVSAVVAQPGFHSRFWAVSRTYRYRIGVGARNPFRDRYSHWIGKELDVQAMDAAAQRFVGEHDFLALSTMLDEVEPTTRTLYKATVAKKGDEVELMVTGSSFVRGMMRRIAGTLVEIGLGKRDAESIEELLVRRPKNEIKFPPHLPANGLTLMKVSYGRHPSDKQFRFRDNPEGQDGKTG